MADSSKDSKIVLIGNDTALAYLVGRYAERSGYDVTILQTVPLVQDVCNLQPVAVLFPSIEGLEIAQSLILGIANCNIPIIVCSSMADEAKALELGVDYCLHQPLTYEGFLTAITAVKTMGTDER